MPLAEDLDKLSQSWESNQHKYPAHIKVEKLEIVGDNDNDPNCIEEEVDVSDRETLAQWLGGDNSFGGPSGPSLKLLLILAEHNLDTDFLTNEEDAKAVTEAFLAAGLPLAGLAAHVTLGVSSAKAPSRYIRRNGTPSLLSRYYFSHPAYCITWAFDHATKNTRAVLIYRNYDIGLDSRVEFAKVLTNNAKALDQPMLLGLVAINFYLEVTDIQQTNYTKDLISIRKSTGLFVWNTETGEIVEVDTSGLDYGRISRVLASLLARIGQHRSRLSVALGFAAFMLQEHHKTSHMSSSGAEDTCLTEAEDMEEAIEKVKGRAEILLGRNQCVRDDLKDMMSAIYNLIAQKDSNVGLRLANHSRTLAIESKRDSSSMKTIAAVTMAFLPGTFVASLFAMPMFDWNKPPGHNVNTGTFWIYWTVTIPLTTSVFLLWWTWLRFKTAREVREDILLAKMDKSDDKRNDGRSGGDSQLDSNSHTRTHTQSSLFSRSPERSKTIWRRIRSIHHNSSSHHGENPKISAPPERPTTPLRSSSVLQQSRSVSRVVSTVPRYPSIETKEYLRNPPIFFSQSRAGTGFYKRPAQPMDSP